MGKKVIIIVNAEVKDTDKVVAASFATETMVKAIKRAITQEEVTVELVATAQLWSKAVKISSDKSVIYCPLTIEIPEFIDFPGKSVYHRCKQVKQMRQWVEEHLGYKVSGDEGSLGDLWLPVVWTKKGPLYAEVVGEDAIPNSYIQPVDLKDEQRQPLYRLAYKLLASIDATQGVYLLQFSARAGEIVFDRLWPFPAAPAIASLHTQHPDLYTCHWYCLTGKPILDLQILPDLVEFQKKTASKRNKNAN